MTDRDEHDRAAHPAGADHGAGPSARNDREDTGETRNQKLQRNVGELLQELRVGQAGVQILFGFLLSVVFTQRFQDASGLEKSLHMVAVLLTVAATALLTAPAAWHRLLFRTGRRDEILRVGNRIVLAGFGCLAGSITLTVALMAKVVFGGVALAVAGGVVLVLFVVLWFVVPLRLPPHDAGPKGDTEPGRPAKS
ncbi:MAG TPA: DUF6328 family protein [Amycolatopsis sp.]|nr:DUF6328 family protein [Amycolatopsis sp.]